MKLYYLQCKQFQFVAFGKVLRLGEQSIFSGAVEIFFRAKMSQSPRK